jgi:hypothetical protein
MPFQRLALFAPLAEPHPSSASCKAAVRHFPAARPPSLGPPAASASSLSIPAFASALHRERPSCRRVPAGRKVSPSPGARRRLPKQTLRPMQRAQRRPAREALPDTVRTIAIQRMGWTDRRLSRPVITNARGREAPREFDLNQNMLPL